MQKANTSCVSRLFSVALRVPMLFSLGLLLDAAVALSAQPSHMGQKVTDHVTFRISRSGNSVSVCDDFGERIFPNGSHGPLLLAGRWFVVTDVTWRTVVGPGFPPQHPGLLRLKIFFGPDEAVLFESNVVLKADDVNDPAVGSEHLTTGFVVSGIPCIEFQQIGNEDSGVGGSVTMEGYLIDRPVNNPRTTGMAP